nr:hypothetical protein [Spiroplasma gladiatoris]
MKTQDNKYYTSIGNDVYNLIEIDDNRLHGNKYTIKKEKLESIKPSKIESPWKYSNWYFFNKKRINTRSIY